MTVRVGHRNSNVHGSELYSAAGQLIYSTASGTTATLAAASTKAVLAADGAGALSWSPQAANVVAADVTHTQSNTTLSDVTGLLVPIGATSTEIWHFDAYLLVATTSTAVDLKLGFTVPSSCTMKWGSIGATSAYAGISGAVATSPTAMNIQSGTDTYGTINGTIGVNIYGFIFGGGTSGNVQLQFAQNTSTAVDLTIQKGSMLRYRRLVA